MHNFNINKPHFCTSSRVNSFTDWPHITSIIHQISQREERQNLWECDYSLLTSSILAYYFHRTQDTTWLVVPEYNHHPDYTIFLWSDLVGSYDNMIHAVVEVNCKTGASLNKLLEVMWNPADLAKNNSGRLWAMGEKGLEICFSDWI